MRKTRFGITLLAAVGLAGAALLAHAEQATAEETMPSGPSAESTALSPFFAAGGSWTGRIPAGARGPDSPETTSLGKAVCRELYGGFWYLCEMQDVIGTSEASITWKRHLLVGFDPALNAYRAMMVDNEGTMTLYEGELEERRFVLETPEAVLMMGQMMRQRLIWERREDGALVFTDQRQPAEDQKWRTFESGEFQPLR
jgi:hypothetical protein